MLQILIVGLIAVLVSIALCRQLKQNLSEIEKIQIEEELEHQKAENKELKEQLNNRKVILDIKTIGF